MGDKPTSILKKLLVAAVMLVAIVWLVNLAICMLARIWWILLIIGILVTLAVFGYRLWKNKHW